MESSVENKILPYDSKYAQELLVLWNREGVKQGFLPMNDKEFIELFPSHPYFSKKHTYILFAQERVVGFVCGCASDDLPRGIERGYFTCLLVEAGIAKASVHELLRRLERSFYEVGKTTMVSNFFNPMRLAWIMPDTNGSIHNNAPGIAIDSSLYEEMRSYGFEVVTNECAMYLNLESFRIPEWVLEKENKINKTGYSIDWYRKEEHKNIKEMVESLGNPQWNQEIPHAAKHINMLVALQKEEVVGFAGPVYPESTGRGYFAGIGVSPNHEKYGLGTLLFYKICQAQKESGATYMSLFTGENNPAKKIYLGAGFQENRVFAVMSKEITK